jgi:hypothetical protein
MKTKLLAAVIIWLCVFGNSAYAQKENSIWYFGEHAGMDFNSGTPVDLSNGALYTEEGCSSISDANGNLLFYTDGVHVWDKNHNQMANGFGLLGEFHSTQSALIVPFPVTPDLYYIFTQGVGLGMLNYSIVDMTLNGGNGDIMAKNFLIRSNLSEKLCGVRNSNGTDSWIMVHSFTGDTLFAYAVTGSGVSSTPVVNKIGHSLAGNDYKGYMKFSSDGTKIAFAAYDNNYVDLFDFDSATGIVSNEKYLTLPPGGLGAYGIEFSVSGHYLYATQRGSYYVYQWDISSNNEAIINSTLAQIGNLTPPSISALQMGPDGKIYVSQTVATYYIGVINYPELSGISCDYIKNALSFSTGSCFYGLPNFLANYFATTGINSNDTRQNQLKISPNPATTTIQLTINRKTNAPLNCEIWNVMGEAVYKSQIVNPKSQINIDISGLAKGIYVVRVGDGVQWENRKLVVE